MLSLEEKKQYSRHLLLDQIGEKGQLKLKNTRVLVIGAGGIGSPLLQYIAAAGVGKITIVDGDRIEQHNLQRQVLFTIQDVGASKARVAQKKLQALNPFIEIHAHDTFINAENAEKFITGVDVILDGSDNFSTRYLVNDTCVKLQKPLIHGSIHKFEAQVAIFNAQKEGGYSADLRSLFAEPPPSELVPDCSTVGVIGALAGICGSLMALELVKLVCNIGNPLIEQLLIFDGLSMQQQILSFEGQNPSTQNKNQSQNPSEISYQAFKNLDKKTIQLIDVRSKTEVEAFNIGGLHIALDSIEENLDKLDTSKQIIVHCKSGARSLKAAETLREKGINALSLKGGILNFK